MLACLAAAAVLAGRLHGDAHVVSLQNGMNAGLLADLVGPERVVECLVNFGADVLEPGVVLRGNRGTFVIGELERCVMKIVVAPFALARPSASVTSRLAPVCEMPRATSPGPSSAEDIAMRSPSDSATARKPSLRNLWYASPASGPLPPTP